MVYRNNKLYNLKLFLKSFQEESNCYNLYRGKIKIKIHLRNKNNKISNLKSINPNIYPINKI